MNALEKFLRAYKGSGAGGAGLAGELGMAEKLGVGARQGADLASRHPLMTFSAGAGARALADDMTEDHDSPGHKIDELLSKIGLR